MLADRAAQTSATEGTGAYELDTGAVSAAYQTFVAGAGNGAVVTVLVTMGDQWEIVDSTVAAGSPDTLTRTLVSSSTGSLINWGVGTKLLRIVAAADLTRFGAAGAPPTAGGSANALTIAHLPTMKRARAGMRLSLIASAANTAAATLAVDGLSAVAIVRGNGAPLQAGVLRAGRLVDLRFDGTAWRIVESCLGWMEVARLAPAAVSEVDILLQNTYYARYRITLTDMLLATTSNSISLRTSINAGSSFFAGGSDYTYGLLYNNGASPAAAVSTAASSIPVMAGAAASPVNTCVVEIGVGSVSALSYAKVDAAHVVAAGQEQLLSYLGYRGANGLTDALRFFSAVDFSGNILVEALSS